MKHTYTPLIESLEKCIDKWKLKAIGINCFSDEMEYNSDIYKQSKLIFEFIRELEKAINNYKQNQ
jgi:hypothetical protein